MGEPIYARIDFDLPTITAESQQRVDEYEKQLFDYDLEQKQKEFESSGVPEKFWKESFETFEETALNKKAFETAVNFADNPKNRVLVFHGNNGTGKSHLLSSIIRVTGGEYITSSMLCMKYDSAIGYKAKMSREEIIDYYIKIKGVLVIDECCKYFLNKELEKFVLLTILCGRYENNRATALGTNSDKQPFMEFLGRAVFDRFTEICTTVEFNWESRRKERRE